MEKLNLYQKIQAVSNEVRNIEKNMQVGKGTYSYKAVGDLDVVLAVKDAETQHKIVSIPTKQELVSSEVLRSLKGDGKESLTYVDTIKMTLRIVDLEDTAQYIEVESFGKGVDPSDKGFGKASTYARKYALLNAYKIATGEDPDSEKSKNNEVDQKPSERRIMVINYLDLNLKAASEIVKHFGVGSVEDLTDKHINTIYKSYKQKKLI